jgi:exopolysaccharide production protein ExoY
MTLLFKAASEGQEVAVLSERRAATGGVSYLWTGALGVQPMLAAALALLFAPLMLVIGLLIYIEDGGPVFFVQKRVGRGGLLFPCVKFRSMRPTAEAELAALLDRDPAARLEWEQTQKLQSDPRVTRIGAALRRHSLDEIPQLFNVLIGQMELVGPRPIVPAEIKRYGRRFSAYCAVRPGLTGLWQVNGRSDTSYRRRVAIDVCYARNKSPALDLLILAATAPIVIFGRGSY